VTAGALMLGTSALAWVPTQSEQSVDGGKLEAASAQTEWSGSKSFDSADGGMKSGDAKLETASFDSADSGVKSGDAKIETASFDGGDKSVGGTDSRVVSNGALETIGATFAGVQSASSGTDTGAKMMQTASADFSGTKDGAKLVTTDASEPDGKMMQSASADFGSKDHHAVSADSWGPDGKQDASAWASKDVSTGMGGPIEGAQDYPPCRPGPGDDRCIQLYERGVSQQLASLKSANTGMGGPLEPAGESKFQTGKEQADQPQSTDHGAMGHGTTGSTGTSGTQSQQGDHGAMGHGQTDAMGHGQTDAQTETDTSGTATGDAGAKPAAGAATTPGGIGGPIEQAADYPPCRPGPGDDRCIQLYERGNGGSRK